MYVAGICSGCKATVKMNNVSMSQVSTVCLASSLLVWPCQMASWTAWIQTAVCRQPVTPPPCAWAPQTPWTSSRRHSCPPLRANSRLSTNECVSWWAGTAPTSFPASTPLMESESFVHGASFMFVGSVRSYCTYSQPHVNPQTGGGVTLRTFTNVLYSCLFLRFICGPFPHSSWHTNCGISGGFVTGRMTVKVPKDFPSSCFLFPFFISSLITCEGLSPYLHPTYFHIFLIQANYPLGV